MDDARLRVCLEREIELPGIQVRFRDWPGFGRAIVHVADPFADSVLIAGVAASLAPGNRVLSTMLRRGAAYQTNAEQFAEFVGAFGLEAPVLLGQGVGALVSVLVAAWQPALVGGLVLVERHDARWCSDGDLLARSVRDCPPDWPALEAALTCPVAVIEPFSMPALQSFLATMAAA